MIRMKKWKFADSISNKWVLATLLVGLCLTALITEHIKSNNQHRITKAVQVASDQAIKTVNERIRLYQYGLRGARGAILTAGEYGLSRRLFMRYSLSRDIDQEFPGARGFGFIRRVQPSDVERFVQRAQQDGWLDFHIKELSPHSGERYVIQYIEPVVRNVQAVGLDIASEKNRRTAAKAAIDTGKVHLTGPITLVQATGNPLQSFLILMPIYNSGAAPKTLKARQDRAYGWSYAPLLMQEVMADLGLNTKNVHLELFDITEADNSEMFFDSNYNQPHGLYTQRKSFPIYGRIWESRFSVYPSFIANLNLPNPRDIFGVGVLISLLSATLLGVVRVSRQHRQEIISQQAKIAAIVESSSDGIVGTTLDGIITSWNKGAEKIFGYKKSDVLGDSVYQLLIPDDRSEQERQIFESIKKGEDVSHFDTVRKTKSGNKIPVSVAISPIYGASGYVIGASKSVRDISLQKSAEAKIRELNNSLENQVKERTAALQTLNLILNDVLNASSEIAIVATDLDGMITLFNSGAQRMLKYSSEEVIGQLTPLSFHFKDEILALKKSLENDTKTPIESELATLFYHAIHKKSDSREWTYIDKQGKHLDVSVVITPMHDDKGVVIGFLNMAIDITKQKKSNAKIISMRDQLLMAANVAQLGIWTWNVQTDELDWNDMMFQIYQQPITLKREGVTYQHWMERLHLEDKADFEQALQRTLQDGEAFDQMYRIVLPNESVRYIQARAHVELDRQGNVTSVTGINRDITQEYELETWLRRAKEEADAASLAKSEFLANMSHEIRTPMNAVLGMLQLVQRTALDVKQADYIAKAHVAAKSLLGLINDILDYSKVDAGKLEIEHAPFSLTQLVSELDTLLSGLAMNTKVKLSYDIDSNIPAFLEGDHLRLLQVLTNLSSNALKFTLEGTVEVSIKQVFSRPEVSHLKFSVKDTGIGIDMRQKENIFEVFSQAESSTARRFGGSGLGLVISRRLVRLMGGELMVESVLGEGSHFYFSLVLPVVDEQEVAVITERLAATASLSSTNRLQGLRLLVVEDNAFNRQVAEELLQAEGAEVTLAEGGEEGVAAVLESDLSAFDLVLMDMQMPNVDGLEATRRIRRDPRFTQLPIVAMTANVSKSDQEACLHAGMNDHLGKPLDIDLMICVICQHVGRFRKADVEPSACIESDAHVSQGMIENRRTEEVASIMARFANNKALYASLKESFLQETGVLLENLEQAMAQRDRQVLLKTAHSLKGSTGTMGLSACSNTMSDIEALLKSAKDDNVVDSIRLEWDLTLYLEQVKKDLESVLLELGVTV
ncbi:CHASE domain-containing protein [Marinomonas sp. NPDC078689]|uniref:CHASE domain-containing protein n=1 Tax=Marinomonas sp. NPDC078689 TaxID=3364147 RepID=UPI0037C657BB